MGDAVRLRKGTRGAKAHMGALRERQRFLLKQVLIAEWGQVTGRVSSEWWAASGLQMGCGQEASIAWLRNAIAQARRAAV